MKIRFCASVITVGIGVLGLTTAPAHASPGDGQDATGNALNPRATSSVGERQPEGLGIAQDTRSPTGLRTAATPLVKEPSKTANGLLYQTRIEFGGIGLDGDKGAAKFGEYKDLGSGAYLNNFTVKLEKPESAFHFDGVGGGVARNDQYYGLDLGKYNTWRLRGSFSETPHLFTTTYEGQWNGIGSSLLTLTGLQPGGLTDANTTQSAFRLAIAGTSAEDLGLTRKKSRARLDFSLPANWTAFASYTGERQAGSRPFGAVFGGGGGGGNVEIPESIDYNTQDVLAGLQFNNALTNVNLRAAASFFRNGIDTLTFQNPIFINTNTIQGIASTTFTQGQFDLYPNNDYFNVKGEFARKLPKVLKSRITGVVSFARSQQNDQLIPWALVPLTGGTINGVPTANMWNTTDSLSRRSADARIDATLGDVGIILNPSRALSVNGKVRYYNTDNSTQYDACNPLVGQWGRLLNNGSGGSFVTPNQTAGNNPVGTLITGYNGTGCDLARTRALGLAPSAGDVPIRNVPYDYRQLNSVVSADYRVNRTNAFDAAFERENFRRQYREREKTWEDKVRLGYVNRAFESGSLRVAYEYTRRRGSDYVANALADFYSFSLGPVPTAPTTNMSTWMRNVAQMQRFDVADRNQNVFSARFNHAIGPALDASVNLQVRDIEYPASEFGRNDHQNLTSPSFELNWQPTPTANAYGFYSFQRGKQHQTGVQPNACVIGNYYYFFSDGTSQTNATGVAPAPPAGTSMVSTNQVLASNWTSLCGAASAASPLFPDSRDWNTSQRDRNTVTGGGFRYELGRVVSEVGYTHSGGRTRINYGYNAAALGLNAVQVALAGDGWPDLTFVQNLVEANALVPVQRRLSLRVIYRYENARIRDWHYDGAVNPMPANNSAYLDFGPQNYKAHLFGVLFRYEL